MNQFLHHLKIVVGISREDLVYVLRQNLFEEEVVTEVSLLAKDFLQEFWGDVLPCSVLGMSTGDDSVDEVIRTFRNKLVEWASERFRSSGFARAVVDHIMEYVRIYCTLSQSYPLGTKMDDILEMARLVKSS